MATGRTVQKWSKVYVDGYDMTGYSRSFGPLTTSFQEADATALGDPVKTAMAGQGMLNVGTINSILDNTTGVSHDLFNRQAARTVLLPIGIRADPAQGDPAFMGTFLQKDFYTEPSENSVVTITIPFSGWATEATSALYNHAWGTLLRAKAATTAVNSAVGVDDRGAATAKGGYMVYQAFTSNGTVTIKVQDAATNSDGSFADLVTSGVINPSSTPVSALVALGATATVRQYLRWQIVLGTATTVTFALGFVRI